MIRWAVSEIELTSQNIHPWWDFPVKAVFKHASDGTEITIEGFRDGGNTRCIRFALPFPDTLWAGNTVRWVFLGHTGMLCWITGAAAQTADNSLGPPAQAADDTRFVQAIHPAGFDAAGPDRGEGSDLYFHIYLHPR